jgi:hypothetical protein
LSFSARQEKRTINHKASILEDGLEMLPLPDAKVEEETTVPITGQEIRDLDGEPTSCVPIYGSALMWKTDENTSVLLELYGVPFTADMFLHDKKMAYLRFVGVSRALMHLVLD